METSVTHTSDQRQKPIFRKIIGDSGNNPKVNFFGLMSFRITGTIFLVTAIFSWLAILCNDNLFLKWQLDSAGFGNAINYFKFPIGILAASVPIVALFATNHRSEQAKAAMLISESQNVFSNYYKHLEEFLKYAASDQLKEMVSKDFDARRAHAYLFDEAKRGRIFVSHRASKEVADVIHVVNLLLGLPNDAHGPTTKEAASELILVIINFSLNHPFFGVSLTLLDETFNSLTNAKPEELRAKIFQAVASFLKYQANTFFLLAEFDTEYEREEQYWAEYSNIKSFLLTKTDHEKRAAKDFRRRASDHAP